MPDLSQLLSAWLDLRYTFDPALATRSGAAGHDGRLPGFDPESIKLQVAGLKAEASAVELLELTEDGEEIDRTALLDVLRAQTFRLEQEQPYRRNPAAWLGALADSWQALIAHPQGTPAARAQFALERLEGTEGYIAKAEKSLKGAASVYAEEALELAPAVRNVAKALVDAASGWLPGLAEKLASVGQHAELAVAAFEHKLREDVTPNAESAAYAIGREAYDHRLHFEHALRPASSELWRWSQHSLEEARAAALTAAQEAGLPSDLHLAARQLRAARPAGDLQTEALRGLARARKWIEEKGLLTLPAAELRIFEMPEPLRLLGGRIHFEAEDVVYLRPGTTNVSAPELFVDVLFELCPGKLTHRSLARGASDPVRRALATPCATDGWALYGLELALTEGLVTDPQERFAVRLAELHTIARGVVDIGLHTEGFTPVAAADLLTQLLPIERSDAVADVRRACAWPTYSLAAAVGRREILELKEAWTAKASAHPPVRPSAFHSDLLSYGGLPISLARWGMDLGLEE